MSVCVEICCHCGHGVFPARALCPVCGGLTWKQVDADSGRVEAITVRDGIWIAAVRTVLGPVVVARCDGQVAVDDVVVLGMDGSVPTAGACEPV